MISLGDANAISGGIHTTTNTTNNVTNVAAQKTELELIQERKNLFLNECKRAYEDNILDQVEAVALEEYRIKLGLDKETADSILATVRIASEKSVKKSDLSPIAKIQLRRLSESIASNDTTAIGDLIERMDALIDKFDNEDLALKYYLALSALKAERCIDLHEKAVTDNYWRTFWSYLAYIRCGRNHEAESLLNSLDRFVDYPIDNITLLATAGELLRGNVGLAKDYLDGVVGEYTLALQRFVDSIYLVVDPQTVGVMVPDEKSCAFYLVNIFGQKDPRIVEAERKAKEEAERKAAEAAAEARRKEEESAAEARRRAEEAAKIEAEKIRLQKEEAERQAAEAEEKARKAAAAEAKKEKARIAKEKKEQEVVKKAQEFYKLAGNYYNGTNGCPKDPKMCVDYLTKSAELGNANAQYDLSSWYTFVNNNVNLNFAKAVEWLAKAANAGHVQAQARLGVGYATGRYRLTVDHAKAYELLRNSAERSNDPDALNCLACYLRSDSFAKVAKADDTRAVSLYLRSAELGNEKAQYNLGQAYWYGQMGLLKDIERAKVLLQKAADKDFVEAVRMISGMMSDEESKKLSRKLLFKGTPEEHFTLNMRFVFWGNGSLSKAAGLSQLQKAAEKGHVRSQYWLAHFNVGCYEKNLGLSRDVAEAAKWYIKAADKGHKIAQFELAKHALSGVIRLDKAIAMQYLRKSASQAYYPALELLEQIRNK